MNTVNSPVFFIRLLAVNEGVPSTNTEEEKNGRQLRSALPATAPRRAAGAALRGTSARGFIWGRRFWTLAALRDARCQFP